MADTSNLEQFLTDVANAIKDKKGTTAKIPAANFDAEIATIETGIDTSDATAAAGDIATGKTAYARGEKLVGTLNPVEDLNAELAAQDEKIAQQETKIEDLINILNVKAASDSKVNLYMQEEAPAVPEGIWLQGTYPVDNMIADRNVYAGEEWNTTKMGEISAIPYKFYYGTAVAIGTDIYLFGGYGGKTTAYKYDMLTNTYTRLPNTPYNVYNGTKAAAVGTNVYLFGGYDSADRKKAYKYDTLTNTYIRLADIPNEFQYGDVAVKGTDVYLIGVYKKDLAERGTYVYNTLTDTYKDLAVIPYGYELDGGSVVAVDTDIYLFGGSLYSSTSYKYNILTNTYTKLADIPYEHSHGAAIAVGTNIYLFGGDPVNTSGKCRKIAYKYNTLTSTYTKLTDIPYEFYAGPAVFVDGDICLLGGYGTYTMTQVLTIIPKEYPNNSIVISQSNSYNQATNLYNTKILNLKVFYDRVYYRNSEGILTNTIPVYNGDGEKWTKIN